jgi:hypothetical protein
MVRILGYQKFCYWLNQKELEQMRGNLNNRGITPDKETHIPCRVLRVSSEIGIVSPSAWEGHCKRKTSWYRTSGRAGKFLMVANSPLDVRSQQAVVIMESDFRPDRFPDTGEMTRMVQSDPFRRRTPPLWDRVEPIEKNFYRRWFKRYEGDEPFDFDRIYLSHSANHANFLDPRFFVTLEDRTAPYSIADSLHTCSSCLEFFDILGEEWPVKYVVPCLGAVLFAHLPRDQYFRVSVKSIRAGGKGEISSRRD